MTHDRPIDPDLDPASCPASRPAATPEGAAARAGSPRPPHLRWSSIALVAAGGTVGAGLRELLVLLVPVTGRLDTVIFCINLSGALALGILLEALLRHGPEDDRRRRLRLLLGTGVLGGYTTYSTLATETARLVGDGQTGLAVLYSLGTVLLGALATWTGVALATRRRRSTDARGAA